MGKCIEKTGCGCGKTELFHIVNRFIHKTSLGENRGIFCDGLHNSITVISTKWLFFRPLCFSQKGENWGEKWVLTDFDRRKGVRNPRTETGR